MQLPMSRTFGIDRCKICKKPFDKKAPNQIHCDVHSFYKRYHGGKVLMKLYEVEGILKQEADESGNPKVYRAGEYTQDELRRLIPER